MKEVGRNCHEVINANSLLRLGHFRSTADPCRPEVVTHRDGSSRRNALKPFFSLQPIDILMFFILHIFLLAHDFYI